MAFKTLVENPSPLERQIAAYVRQLSESGRDFSLAMLVPSETALSDRWNLVVSAPWIDREGLRAAIPSITAGLLKHLSRASAGKLERVSVLATTDPLVERIADMVSSSGVYRIQSFPAVGTAGEAIVLVAQRPTNRRGLRAQPAQSRA